MIRSVAPRNKRYFMKIAVTSTGETLQSAVDPRFGRAKYIILVDSEDMTFEVIDNSDSVNTFKGAGIQAGTLLSDKGVEILLTGYCGPNAFKTLDAAGIKVVNDVTGTVEEGVSAFKAGSLQVSSAPNAEGHW